MMPGDVARLRVWRYDVARGDARTLTVEVRLDRLDPVREIGVIPKDQESDAIEQLGLARMSTSTPDLADEFDVRFYRGVLIEEIVPGSQLDGVVEPGTTIVSRTPLRRL